MLLSSKIYERQAELSAVKSDARLLTKWEQCARAGS